MPTPAQASRSSDRIGGPLAALHRILFTAASPHARTIVYVVVCGVAAAICVSYAASLHPIAFPLDDAYITIHNAEVLIAGSDVNYPGVPALMGATSTVHLALVALLMHAAPPLVALFAATALGVVLYAAGLVRLAFQAGGSAVLAFVVAVVGLLAGYTPFQLFNGLESGLAMAAVAWALAWANEPGRSPKLPLLAGVMPFIRPELAALSLGLLALRSQRRWAAGDGAAAIAGDLALAALAAAPWLAWIWISLGALVPPTAAAKAAFFAETTRTASQKLGSMLFGLKQSGLLPLMFGALLLQLRSWLWLFVALFLGAFYLTLPGGLGHNYSRYVFVLSPVWLYLLVLAARDDARAAAFSLALFAGALATTPAAFAELARTPIKQTEWAALASWCEANIPHDAPVLIHDAGYIAYATDLRLIDLVGLKTPESVGYHRELTAPSGGRLRPKAISEIAKRFGARYAIVLDDPDHFWGAIADGLWLQGWTLKVERPPSPGFGYAVYSLKPPG